MVWNIPHMIWNISLASLLSWLCPLLAPFPLSACSLWHSTGWETESLDFVQPLLTIAKTLVLVTNLKHSTKQAAKKKVDSIPAGPSTNYTSIPTLWFLRLACLENTLALPQHYAQSCKDCLHSLLKHLNQTAGATWEVLHKIPLLLPGGAGVLGKLLAPMRTSRFWLITEFFMFVV